MSETVEGRSSKPGEGRPSPRGRGRLIGFTVAVVVGIAVFVGFQISPWFHDQVLESVSRRPTPFTELYFSVPPALPKHLDPDRPNRFSFVIVNHEGRAVDYAAEVVLRGPRGDVPLGTEPVRVLSGRSFEQAVQFLPDQRGAEYLVTVRLRGRPEIIHFSANS